jgi:lysophospholipase L1-like esterase
VTSEQLLPELLRLDAAGDHAGVAAAFEAARLDPAETAFAIYQLLINGRFRSAHAAVRGLTGAGAHHPVIELARALGGILFGASVDAAAGTASLAQAVAHFAAGQRRVFEDQVLARVFQQAMVAQTVALDAALGARLRGFFASLSTRFAAPGAQASLPGVAFPDPVEAALSPFWRGVEMVETLTFVRTSPHAPPQARPLFRPDRVLRLTSATRDVLFEPGSDYELDAASGLLTLPAGSRVAFKTLAELMEFAGFRLPFPLDDARSFHFPQVEIAYTHAPGQWQGPVPAVAEAYLPRTLATLRARGALKLMVLGDSIGGGAGSSAGMKLAPNLPGFVDQVASGLERAHGATVTLENLSRGGWSSDVGARLAIQEKLGTRRPDLVLVAFGMNDITYAHSGHGEVFSAGNYGLRIAAIIEAIRRDAGQAEFILVAPMFGNGESALFPPAQFAAYRDELQRLTGRGVALADVTGILEAMLRTKSWYDTSFNGVNHPNDFMHRLYAQIVLALLAK